MSVIIDFTNVMTPDDMQALRKAMGFTQSEMADAMGLSKSGYVAIESGASPMRKLHQLAVERVCLAHAARLRNFAILPAALRSDAENVTKALYSWLGQDRFKVDE